MANFTKEQLRNRIIERDGKIRSSKLRIGILENRIAYLLEQRDSKRQTIKSRFKFEDIPCIRSRKRKKVK